MKLSGLLRRVGEGILWWLELDGLIYASQPGALERCCRALLKRPAAPTRHAVAQFVIATTRTVPSEATLDEIELNGAPGLVLRTAGRPLVAILIETDGEHIHSVFAVANPDKLGALTVLPRKGSQTSFG